VRQLQHTKNHLEAILQAALLPICYMLPHSMA
jgi:hypothetical protein